MEILEHVRGTKFHVLKLSLRPKTLESTKQMLETTVPPDQGRLQGFMSLIRISP